MAVFASGRGTNAERIFQHFHHHPSIAIVLLVSSSPSAPVLQCAQRFHVPAYVLPSLSQGVWVEPTLAQLRSCAATHIVLAGFVRRIPTDIVAAYPRRIINIHPSLLPRHGGKGMYGQHVHEAVKATGDAETGITIHYVDERYDSGKIIFQAHCPVDPHDAPQDIAAKVLQLEHAHYPSVIEQWATGAPVAEK